MNKITIEEFWKWFQEKSEFLMDIDNMDPIKAEDLMNEFEQVLASYSEGMSFEMSELDANGRTIIFSAEGDEDFFDDVIQLCENAPVLDFWEIVAFKQPQGSKVKIKFENYVLNSKDLWFIPMENEEDDIEEKIGLEIAIKGYNEEDEDQLIAVYSLIEAMIGEYDCTTLLGYFELCEMPESPELDGFIPLTELPEYIDWYINNIEGKECERNRE
jgi:hypothetical protein